MTKPKIDPKYIGVPNIQFSLTKKGDDREKKFSKQRIERGFDDSELWSLRDTIANFIIPRLSRYIDHVAQLGSSHGFSEGELDLDEENKQEVSDLKKILRAFELTARNNGAFILTEEEMKEFDEGITLFPEMFLSMWT